MFCSLHPSSTRFAVVWTRFSGVFVSGCFFQTHPITCLFLEPSGDAALTSGTPDRDKSTKIRDYNTSVRGKTRVSVLVGG